MKDKNSSALLRVRPADWGRKLESAPPQTEPDVSQSYLEGLLIERVSNGDHEAFLELLRPCERRILVSALWILGNEADAEDVAQEAILKAFRALGGFRRESKFSTWLTQIVINEAKMRIRKEHRHLYESLENGSQGDDGGYLPREVVDWREIPSKALENRELREMLSQAIESLPTKYRAVLVLRDVEHLTIRETANLLGITEANVRTRLSRARLQSRDIICSLRRTL